jgi:hypothetical protein
MPSLLQASALVAGFYTIQWLIYARQEVVEAELQLVVAGKENV